MAKRSMMKRPPGMVPRGRTIRLYPTLEQKQHMRLVQDEARHAWNHLVKMYNAKVKERYEVAEKDSIIGPAPKRPEKGADDGTWKAYWFEVNDRRKKAAEHRPDIRMEFPRPDAPTYKMLWAEWEKTGKPRRMTANMYQALIQDFAMAMRPKKGVRWRPPRRRSDADPMPIRTGTGYNVKPSGERHRNALVQLPGLGWMLGIAHRDLDRMVASSMVQGVAFTEHTDGWYAAVRIWIPESGVGGREPEIADTAYVEIGVDVLCEIKVFYEMNLSMETVKVWRNPRLDVVDVPLPKEGPLPKIKRMPRGRCFEKGEKVDNKWRESPERATTRRARHVGNLVDVICKELTRYREVVLPRERPVLPPASKGERGPLEPMVFAGLTVVNRGCPYAMAPGRLWTALKNRLGDRVRFAEEKAA